MRNKKRIPICLDLFSNKEILSKFLEGPCEYELNQIYEYYNNIIKPFWLKNSDLRFGQLLINLGFIEDDHRWYIEEVNWLVDNNYVKVEDICFWGVNFKKDGTLRKYPKQVLLKDLKTDHIANILAWFDRNGGRIIPSYKKYFKKRLNQN